MNCTKRIDIMQHNLVHIRKSLGMSAEQFGCLIGFTRQTINNIENGRSRLTLSSYYAILYVLEKIVFPNCSNNERETVNRLLAEKVIECDYKKSLTFKEGL